MANEHPTGTFADRLQRLMAQRQLSQTQLARRAGVSPTAIGRYLAGQRRPRLGTVVRLAAALDIAPELLAHGEPTLDWLLAALAALDLAGPAITPPARAPRQDRPSSGAQAG